MAQNLTHLALISISSDYFAIVIVYLSVTAHC